MVMAVSPSSPAGAHPSLAEVDIELFAFVERYATNLIRWDLLLFFGNHPEAHLTAAELARKLRRGVKTVTKELDDLTYLRVLVRRYTPQQVTYQLALHGGARRAVIRLAAFSASEKRDKK